MRTAYLTALIIVATASSTFAAPIPELSGLQARAKMGKSNSAGASSSAPVVQPPQRANSGGHSTSGNPAPPVQPPRPNSPATPPRRPNSPGTPPRPNSPGTPPRPDSPTPSSHNSAAPAPDKPTVDEDRNYRLGQIQTGIQAASLAQTAASQWANYDHTVKNDDVRNKQAAAAAAKPSRRAFYEEYYGED